MSKTYKVHRCQWWPVGEKPCQEDGLFDLYFEGEFMGKVCRDHAAGAIKDNFTVVSHGYDPIREVLRS